MSAIPDLTEKYKAAFPQGVVLKDEPMSRHTSFRIGGRVKAMFLPKSVEEIELLCRMAEEFGVRSLVIGNGTNLLVTDADIDMIVIKTSDGLCRIWRDEREKTLIHASSGIVLAKLAVFAMENGLAGFEFAHGIPGSLGGAVSMNAGAYGGEIKDVLESVKVLEGGKVKEYSAGDCELSYRHSRFSDTNIVILEAALRLKEGNKEEIKAKMEELSAKRRGSQPLNMPSAGSTFKRPAGGYAAAMIEEAGLKGKGVGGAQVSEKHAGFVVNKGGATFEDVIKTMEMIRQAVYSTKGVILFPEVKIIK